MSFRIRLYFLSSLLWFLLTSEEIKFSHLTIEDGLSQSSVKCLFQDYHGFLWIGTADGLNKFDGYQFEKFNSNPINPFSLSGNDISCIYENPYDSSLWIGTQNSGLNIYNREHANFHSFSGNSKKTEKNLPIFINDILSTGKTLWIATEFGGLKFFNATDSSFASTAFSNSDDFETINCLQKDNDGNLWFGTRTGLYKWRYANKFNNEIPEKIIIPEINQDLNVSLLKFDIKGNLWIGTENNGLIQYHPKSKNTLHFVPDNTENTISDLRIYDILERKNGEIWIATAGGLCKYLPGTKKFEIFTHDPSNPESINNNTVYSLLEGHSGIIWVGTYLGGLNKIDPIQARFTKFNTFSELNRGNRSTNDIRSISVDDSNTVWLGTSNGLVEIGNKNSLTNRTDLNAKIHFNGKQIGAIVSFQDGIIFSSNNKIQLKTHTNTNINLSEEILKQTNKNVNRFLSAMVDELNHVWLGTEQGLIKYIPEQNKFEIYKPKTPEKEKNLFRPLSVKMDQTGIIWIGTFYGELYSFDRYSKQFNLVFTNDSGNELISFTKIFSLCTAIPNEIWIGTNLGLYQFTPVSGKTNRYLTTDGLANNVVYGAIADKKGNIWCSTNLGVSKLDVINNKIQNYTYQDGLQSNEFNQGAFFKDPEGNIYFGGIAGLNIFNPDKILPNSFIPRVVITAMEIQYENVTPISHHDILEKQISETHQLKLTHNQNTFSFEFTALSFSLPTRNKYQYTLTQKGENDSWIDAGHRRFATYTNITPGEYTFKVKGSNSDGIFNDIPTTIELNILPPFWQTWWFRLLLVLLGIGIIYLIIYNRIKSITRQKIILKKLVKEKTKTLLVQTKQIESQNEELKTINEQILSKSEKIKQKNKLLNEQHSQISKQRDNLLQLAEKVENSNQTKFRFFTSISHELRTPLTLITSPLKDLLENFDNTNKKEVSRRIKNVYNSASKLLLIVNQLLDFRKAETENLELRISQFELAPFIQKCAFLFNDISSQRKIDFKFSTDAVDLKIWADQDILEKTIFNLLSNAFKATPNEGAINIHISKNSTDNKNHATISIKDTGSGIEQDKIPRIFERFYQLDDTPRIYHTGSGLGLALVKKYIDLHHGTISVESIENKGSEFKIELPIGRKHFGDGVQLAEQYQGTQELFVSSISDYLPSISKTSDSNSSIKKATLLLIDDNKNLRTYLSEMLSGQFNVLDADSAKKGLHLAEIKNPDLIISDIMLPDSDGFLLCKKLKSQFKTSHIPVILLTSLADKENHMFGIKAGADAYITKPFDLQQVLLTIENLIEGRRSLHKRFSLSDSNNIEEVISNQDDQIFIKNAIKFVEENLKDTSFNVEQLCSLLKLSQPQCYRKIKATTGSNISEFIRNTRLKKASKLLKSGDYKINEIAYEVGFNDANYFTKSFIKLFGMTPSDYSKL